MSHLQTAFEAWRAGEDLRSRRRRYKNYTYGRQWLDPVEASDGSIRPEGAVAAESGSRPLTNNMIRQLVKCVTGNFRAGIAGVSAGAEGGAVPTSAVGQLPAEIAARNCVDELDCRMLEEFLISGCAIQRVVTEQRMGGGGVWIDNVSPERFFVNRFTDLRGLDIEIVGMLHDYSLREVMMRYGGGVAQRESRIAEIYAAAERCPMDVSLGDKTRTEFFIAPDGRCRVIEVWTLESRNVLKCHDPLSASVFLTPAGASAEVAGLNRRRARAGVEELRVSPRITTRWHCRCYAPSGELLDEYDSPYAHGQHPFVVKFYPLTDGEVHSFVEDIIEQQRYINRLITLIDHIMSTSAKGVLLFPTDRKPDFVSWEELGRMWAKPSGIIPMQPSAVSPEPHQVIAGTEHAGAYRLLDMQLQLFQQISGVNGALQGRAEAGNPSAARYEAQVRNSAVAILDLLETFNAFRRRRNELVCGV